MKKIAIIGQGYVGLNLAMHASKKSPVVGFDLNYDLVSNLNNGKSHIEGIENATIRERITTGNYFASSIENDISDSEIVVIAVPTPLTISRNPDLSYLQTACEIIARNLKHPALIINESTSYPGTLRNFIAKNINSNSKVHNHMYAVSPERVDPGRIDYDQKNTPRLYSSLTREGSLATKDFYSSFCDVLVEVSSPEVAEAAKLFENTFRQVNIALVNEFAQICHAMKLPVREILDAANTKPYGFMKFNPSAGVGGHCIPVDPSYLAQAAIEHGINAKFIELSNKVNLEMGEYIAERVCFDNGGSLLGKEVQLIGISYKPNVADVRETPAEQIQIALQKKGAKVTWHDPLVDNWHKTRSSKLGAKIGILVTMHDEFFKSNLQSKFEYLFDTTGRLKGVIQL